MQTNNMKYKHPLENKNLNVNIQDILSINIFKRKYCNNYIYILFRAKDISVIVSRKISVKRYQSEGYQIIGQKHGTERELQLIRIIVSEISSNTPAKTISRNYLNKISSQIRQLGYKSPNI